MITIKTKNESGTIAPLGDINNAPFGRKFDGTNWLIFESQQEADENITAIEIPSQQQGSAVQAIMSATPEEIEIIKQILNK